MFRVHGATKRCVVPTIEDSQCFIRRVGSKVEARMKRCYVAHDKPIVGPHSRLLAVRKASLASSKATPPPVRLRHVQVRKRCYKVKRVAVCECHFTLGGSQCFLVSPVDGEESCIPIEK